MCLALFVFSITGDIKKLLVHKTGLEPEEQRLFFRGIEKDDKENLHLGGVKDKSKLLLLEGNTSKERKLEETRKLNEMIKASEAISRVKAEVDKLSDRVRIFRNLTTILNVEILNWRMINGLS